MISGKNLFFVGVAAVFVYILSPLLLPIMMGGVLAVLFHPVAARMGRSRLGHGCACALLTLGVTILILLPTAALVYVGVKNGLIALQTLRANPASSANWAESFLKSAPAQKLLDFAGTFVTFNPAELVDTVRDAALAIGARAADLLGGLATRIPGTILDLVMIIVSLYFFLTDGIAFVDFVKHHSVYGVRETDRILTTLGAMCRSVVLASVLSGAVQGVIMAIAALVVRQPNALLLGMVVFIGSFIPVIGSAPVTFGLALYYLFGVSTGAGVGLLITAAVVSTIDNVVRAVFLKGAVDLHPLLAFVAAFGGLQAFGFLGIFLGPIIAALFLSALQEVRSP